MYMFCWPTHSCEQTPVRPDNEKLLIQQPGQKPKNPSSDKKNFQEELAEKLENEHSPWLDLTYNIYHVWDNAFVFVF